MSVSGKWVGRTVFLIVLAFCALEGFTGLNLTGLAGKVNFQDVFITLILAAGAYFYFPLLFRKRKKKKLVKYQYHEIEDNGSYLIYIGEQGHCYKPHIAMPVFHGKIKDTLEEGLFKQPRSSFKDRIVEDLLFVSHAEQEEDIPEFFTAASGRLKVISDKFKNLVENAKVGELEFLPVKIKLAAMDPVRVIDGYWIMNIIETLDVIDMKKSDLKVQKDPESRRKLYSIEGWQKLVLTIDQIDDDLFRLPGMRNPLFVSENFLRKLEEAGIRNVEPKAKHLETGKEKYLPYKC
ncbi:imm11 family protein [Emcibacter sp.]|uniref:imm11 family protein n=1 Tax=Emcibacter sp. TaxID=1979954 RepID=UPI002AA8A981|nr:DUF1629 domain-containing protein [Emcibacter sp.]